MNRGFPQALFLAGFAFACGAACASAAERGDNVFLPRTDQAPAANFDADLDALQLAGITFIGQERLFNFVDPRSRRSFWVPLNGSANGFDVRSYDSNTDSVVVQRGAVSKTIKLRRSVIVAVATPNSPAPVPGSVAPAGPPPAPQPQVVGASGYVVSGSTEIVNPKTPQQIAQAETEARMLVSDLLEISMQERARQRALREGRQAQAQQPQAVPAPATPQR